MNKETKQTKCEDCGIVRNLEEAKACPICFKHQRRIIKK